MDISFTLDWGAVLNGAGAGFVFGLFLAAMFLMTAVFGDFITLGNGNFTNYAVTKGLLITLTTTVVGVVLGILGLAWWAVMLSLVVIFVLIYTAGRVVSKIRGRR